MSDASSLMIAKELGERIEAMSDDEFSRLVRAKDSAEREILHFTNSTGIQGYIEFVSVGITLWIMPPRNKGPGYIFDLELHDPDQPDPSNKSVRIFDSFQLEDGGLVCKIEPELIYSIVNQRLAEGALLHVC